MAAITSPFSALRFSGRLMVIQNACPRFSAMTLDVSCLAPSLPCFDEANICGRSAEERKRYLRRSASTQFAQNACASGARGLAQPDLVVVECGAADRRDRVRARQHVDAAAADVILVRMNG